MKKAKTVVLCKERDVTLTPWLAEKQKPCFLILPGGAYRNCAESEGVPVAKILNEKGYSAFILRYSVGKHYRWPLPLEDFEAAMNCLQAHSEDWYIDPNCIVTIGFSAGGHLAAVAASAASPRPYAAVICYGAISRETLDYCAPDAPDAASLVNDTTRPCFLASSRNDWIVPIENTTNLMTALQRYDIDYEAHVYGYALHGFSVGEPAGATGPLFCSRVGNWVQDCLQWLEELTSGRYNSIRQRAQYQDAHNTCLSVANSCALLERYPEAMAMIKRKFPVQYLLYTTARQKIGDFMDTVSLKNLYQLLKVSDKTLERMDQALACYPILREMEEV